MVEGAIIPAVLPESDAVKPGKTYSPSEAYLSKCNSLSTKQGNAADAKDSIANKKLLILDLNGTLISRTQIKKNATFFARPYFRTFFDYIFREFNVMVWSSAQERTVNHICQIFEPHPLLLKWHRGHFNLRTEEFRSNIEVLKNLEQVWTELPGYDETNTIVIDDTSIKLSLQPHNLIKISTFSHKSDSSNSSSSSDSALLQLIDYLKILKDEPNAAYYIKNNPFIQTDDINIGTGETPVEFLAGGSDKRFRELTPPLPTSKEYALHPDSINSLSEPPKKKKKPRHKKLKKLLALQLLQEQQEQEQRKQQQVQEQQQ